MKKVKLIILNIFIFLSIAFLLIFFSAQHYPKNWNDKMIGQKRNLIHKQLGAPAIDDLWDVKADIWIKESIYSRHRLDVIYNSDSICEGYMVNFYLGVKSNSIKYLVEYYSNH